MSESGPLSIGLHVPHAGYLITTLPAPIASQELPELTICQILMICRKEAPLSLDKALRPLCFVEPELPRAFARLGFSLVWCWLWASMEELLGTRANPNF